MGIFEMFDNFTLNMPSKMSKTTKDAQSIDCSLSSDSDITSLKISKISKPMDLHKQNNLKVLSKSNFDSYVDSDDYIDNGKSKINFQLFTKKITYTKEEKEKLAKIHEEMFQTKMTKVTQQNKKYMSAVKIRKKVIKINNSLSKKTFFISKNDLLDLNHNKFIYNDYEGEIYKTSSFIKDKKSLNCEQNNDKSTYDFLPRKNDCKEFEPKEIISDSRLKGEVKRFKNICLKKWPVDKEKYSHVLDDLKRVGPYNASNINKEKLGIYNKHNKKPISIKLLINKLKIKTHSFLSMPKDVVKIGEASFSDVFLCQFEDNNVFKIKPNQKIIVKLIPFTEHYTAYNFYKECFALHNLNQHKGIISTLGFCILKGEYSKEFKLAWDESNNRSETLNPDLHIKSSRYGCVFMENGGSDMESYKFNSSQEGITFLTIMVNILISLENDFKFEHRDLHWGNILLKKIPENSGIKISLIDFALSRFETDDYLCYTDFANKNYEWLFIGDSTTDIQYEVYKQMKNTVKNWSDFKNVTNLLWIKYLCRKTLEKCSLFEDDNKPVLIKIIKEIESTDTMKKLEEYIKTVK